MRFILSACLVFHGATGSGSVVADDLPLNYPEAPNGAQVDVYHGTKVADPYRWLESLDSDRTKSWVAAQNKVTFSWLDRSKHRERFQKRLKQLWDYERFGLPRKRGTRYFFEHNDGLQNQSILYVADGLEAEPQTLLDPNQLSDDGTVDLTSWRVSEDGRYLAYGLSSAGSDWQEWKVREVDSREDLTDHLQWIKFSSVSWTKDHQGFFYSRYDQPPEGEQYTGANYYQKLYYHHLGQPQEEDTLVYQRQDQKEWGYDGEVTEDGAYLVISVWRGTLHKNQIFYKHLLDPSGEVVQLISGFEAEYQFIGNDDSVFWFSTDLDAPKRRVIAIDVRAPERDNWRTVIDETDDVLESVGLVGDRFFTSYLHDAHALVKVHDLRGSFLHELELPGLGAVSGLAGRREEKETFYAFSSFTTPTTIYRYDIAAGTRMVFRRPRVDFDPQKFETRQVFYSSRDGTRVPMFITAKEGLRLDGTNPTILYGYGGFDISLTPSFSVMRLAWLEAGGVYAVANLRGGGEYGRDWHEAGMQGNKQNVFDDFIAGAQWLIDSGYTSRQRLGIFGRSNGGLLVGAAMTQRPDLFAAAVPGVGVLDMLRYHKFTIGWAWVSEFGSSESADEFKTLYAYSPLHNLRAGTRYPATLITTSDHDDRVVPAHSYKFAAALQSAQAADGPPALIRIETSAGHGAGKPTSKIIEESADTLAFFAEILQGKAHGPR